MNTRRPALSLQEVEDLLRQAYAETGGVGPRWEALAAFLEVTVALHETLDAWDVDPSVKARVIAKRLRRITRTP